MDAQRTDYKKPYLSRSAFLYLFIILLFGALIRWLSFVGFSASDPATYSEVAHRIATGQWQIGKEYGGAPAFTLRLGVLLPTATLYKLFGVSELAMVAAPFLLSLANVVLAYFGGLYIGGIAVGLLSALIMSVVPLEVSMATQLLPDLPLAFGVNASILLLLYGARSRSIKGRMILATSSGLALGYAWLSKESTLYCLPAIGALAGALFYCKRTTISVVIIALGAFVLVLCMEALFYRSLTGDYLFRIHETSRNIDLGTPGLFTENASYGYGYATGKYWEALFDRLFLSGPESIFLNSLFGYTPLVAILSLILGFRFADKSSVLIAIWFCILVFTFNFGTMSLDHWKPLVIAKGAFDRYMQPIVLPAVMLSAWFIHFLVTYKGSHTRQYTFRFGGIFLLLCISISNAKVLNGYFQARGNPALASRVTSQFVNPGQNLYTDERSLWGLNFFWQYPAKSKSWDFAGLQAADIPPNSFVLVNNYTLGNLTRLYNRSPPPFTKAAPPWWFSMWRSHNSELFFVPAVNEASDDSYSPKPIVVPGNTLALLNSQPQEVKTSSPLTISEYGKYEGRVSLPRHVTKVTFGIGSVSPDDSLPFLTLLLRTTRGKYRAFVMQSYRNISRPGEIAFSTDIPNGEYFVQLDFFNAGDQPRTQSFVLTSVKFQ